MLNNKKFFCLSVLLCIIAPQYAQAIDLNAGDYDPAPAGTTLGLFYLENGLYNSADSGGSRVPGRNREHTQIGIVGLAHYMVIDGVLAVPVILQPFGQATATFEGESLGSSKGLADTILAMPFWPINNPQTHTYLVVAPFLYLPTGRYSNQSAINLSDHRYRGTLQVAFSTHLGQKIAWDGAVDATIYGHNTDAVDGGTLSQKPGYELQTSFRYFVSPSADIRAGIAYTNAGDSTHNGVTAGAYTDSKVWLGTGLWVSSKTEMILTYGRDIEVRNGFKDADQVNMKVVYVF